jgi:hypothetical protein
MPGQNPFAVQRTTLLQRFKEKSRVFGRILGLGRFGVGSSSESALPTAAPVWDPRLSKGILAMEGIPFLAGYLTQNLRPGRNFVKRKPAGNRLPSRIAGS